ncbi:MAG: hypothetical protein D6806_02930 [Deltaproteobacteria bacterium]|nr:MAG: hypothetical protein D6806_02930 [Deltaproteobacteria bacterium]
MTDKPRVILTAGFDRAPHVSVLAQALQQRGCRVEGLIVVSPYNWKRLKGLIRQRGASFVRSAIPRLLGADAEAAEKGADDLAELMEEWGLRAGSLRAWARGTKVAYRMVSSINAPEAVELIREKQPDWVVYGGGGILREAVIDAAKGRILNAHSGPLPEIRGMNACEWSLLLGYTPTVTIHLINRGIDTGGVISAHPVPVHPGDTIEVLRRRCVAIGVRALLETVLHPPPSLPPPLQHAEQYRQCFVMAPAIRELLARRLAQGRYLSMSNASSV